MAALAMVAFGLGATSQPAAAAGPEAQGRVGFTGLDGPTGMAVDSAGSVFVADVGNNRILKLAATGAQQVLPFSGLNAPGGVAVDTAGNVFVTDTMNGRVVKLPALGGLQQVLGFSGLVIPAGIALDSSGGVIVADAVTGQVVKLPGNGGAQQPVGTVGSARGVAVDTTGAIYVVDGGNNTVVRFPAGGGAGQTLPFTGLDQPAGVFVDAAKTVYVADAANHRVLALANGSNTQRTLPFTGLFGPSGVVATAQGSIYITDTGNDRVLALPAAGTQFRLGFTSVTSPKGVDVADSGAVLVADSAGSKVVLLPADGGPEQVLGFTGLANPFGVAFGVAGDVVVSDTGNNRVLRLLSDGTQATLPFTGLSSPSGLAVDPDGWTYVADTGNDRVVRLAPGGGPQEVLPLVLVHPTDVALDGSGDLFVADSSGIGRVLELPADWGPARVAYGIGANAIDASYEGDLLVAHSSLVIRVPAGWGTPVAVPFSDPSSIAGVAYGPDGNVVVTAGGRVVQRTGPIPVTPTGLVRVTTSPAVPSQITLDGEIADSWALDWVEVPAGSHSVCFREVPGFSVGPNPCEQFTVAPGETKTINRSFTPQGWLKVSTSPPVASRISVDGLPRDNWGVWTDLPVGSHEVCFGPVADHLPPPCQTVEVTAGATTEVTGAFTDSPGAPGLEGVGFLRVETSPAVPSQLWVDGHVADRWGIDWLELEPGAHDVCWGAVEGFSAGSETCWFELYITEGETRTVTAPFQPNGYLQVLTDPPTPGTIAIDGQPADAWGTYTDRPVGTHQVCFGAVPGLRTPSCQTAVVTAGETTTVTASYG